MRLGVVEYLAVQDDLGAMCLRVHDFHAGCIAWHYDDCGNSQPTRMIGHALGVIARRGSDDPPRTLLRGLRQQLIERTTLLEGGGELMVLELDVDLRAGDRRKGSRVQT